MFTGLVEGTGRVIGCTPLQGGARYDIELPFADEIALGDSVAVNGCCLTVDAVQQGVASFDLLSQTLRVTSLGQLRVGSLCNLERAMLPSSRLGGHFVSGHIDTTGELVSITPVGQDHMLRVRVPDLRYVIDKGSVSIDGVSLTIAAIDREKSELEFWITPHTWRCTIMPAYAPGTLVNVEWDMLAKYVEAMLSSREDGKAE